MIRESIILQFRRGETIPRFLLFQTNIHAYENRTNAGSVWHRYNYYTIIVCRRQVPLTKYMYPLGFSGGLRLHWCEL